jgi:hypothetical protein
MAWAWDARAFHRARVISNELLNPKSHLYLQGTDSKPEQISFVAEGWWPGVSVNISEDQFISKVVKPWVDPYGNYSCALHIGVRSR